MLIVRVQIRLHEYLHSNPANNGLYVRSGSRHPTSSSLGWVRAEARMSAREPCIRTWS
jgi:hypothetical protein